MNIIETRDLRKSFKSRQGKGKPQEVEAVKGVSMKVEKGEIFGFLGPTAPVKPQPYGCFQRYCHRQAVTPKWLVTICCGRLATFANASAM